MASFARAAALGVASTLLVIAALCVLDASVSSRFEEVTESSDDLRGNSLLKAQAKALNEERHLQNKGRDMQSVDEMLHGFQEHTDDDYSSLTEALEKQAPKKDDLDVALAAQAPDASGIIHFQEPKPKTEDELTEEFAADMEFVQDWKPSGQVGLADDINAVKSSDEEEALKADHLEGHGVLSAVGLAEDEHTEDPFDTMSLVQTEATWEPTGQAGLASTISDATAADEEAEAKENGLEGDSLLSSVGISSDNEADHAFDAEELGLVQMEASEWVPQGQPGLASAISDKQEADEAAEAKENGLQGDSLLGAVGIDQDSEETEFVQDAVTEWKPKGQKVKVKHYKNEEDEALSAFQEEKNLHEDGLYGDSLLSAVGLGEHERPTDEMSDLGTIKPDELDLDLD